MRFDDALDWYVNSHRTAEDVERATGVSVAVQRLLQKHKIFSPVPQAERTAKRLLFNDTLMRLAIAGELNRCGIPLIAASKIIHADMWLDDFQMSLFDPFQMFVEWDAEQKRYVKTATAKGDPDGLYDRKNPVAPHKHDQHIEIINNRFVVSRPFMDEEGTMLGELSSDKSDFIIWKGHTFDHIVAGEKLRPTLIDDSGLWKKTSSKTPTKADEKAAEFARANPLSKLSVNAGMALRAALRRLLFIDK